MLKIPQSIINQFRGYYETHRVHIAAMNVFFQNIRLINGHHKLIDRDLYQNYFLKALSDIELKTPPTDAFVPCKDDESDDLFIANQLAPEYGIIKERVTLEVLEDTLGVTHDVVMKVKENANLMTTVYDDLFLNWCIFKYIDQIDLIRLKAFSTYTPAIEYIVQNITLKDWKEYLSTTKRKNIDKYGTKCEDLLFNPDVTMTQKFYAADNGNYVPKFDVVDLMIRMVSNTVFKSDIYACLGVYMIISFAMADFKNVKLIENKEADIDPNKSISPCADYVRDVLSVL